MSSCNTFMCLECYQYNLVKSCNLKKNCIICMKICEDCEKKSYGKSSQLNDTQNGSLIWSHT